MRKILVTGMSGTGKSTALVELGARGHRVVDTDSAAWSHWVTLSDGSPDWVLREPEMRDLLVTHDEGVLYVSGCTSNQGMFYPQFDEVVLLSAPREVILERIAHAERAEVLHNLATIEPRLRWTATVELDASKPLAEVVRELEEVGDSVDPSL